MNFSDENIALFDRAFHQMLDEAEQAEFQKRLDSDDEFQKEYKVFTQSINVIEKKALKDELKKIIEEDRKVIPLRRYYYFAAAASLVLILSLTYFLQSPQSSTSLFDEFYTPYPSIYSFRSDMIGADQAFSAYSSGNYNLALSLLKKQSTSTDTTSFYIGMCHLSLNEPDSAIKHFSEISESSIFYNSSNWYKALSLVQLNQTDSALRVLENYQAQGKMKERKDELIDKLTD